MPSSETLKSSGEAVKRLPDEYRAAHPEIPWKTMAAFRDVLIHGYEGVDPALSGLHAESSRLVPTSQISQYRTHGIHRKGCGIGSRPLWHPEVDRTLHEVVVTKPEVERIFPEVATSKPEVERHLTPFIHLPCRGILLRMSIKLPLNEMTLQEKLEAMESLWEDLSHTPETIESPQWHEDVLNQRRQRVAEGTAQFEDWETAKSKIRERLR